jgi:hypothetical protein
VLVPSIGRDDLTRDEAWTYAALNASANQLARHLVREHRVGPTSSSACSPSARSKWSSR